MVELPLLEHFNLPFKFLPYILYCLSAGGTLVLQAYLSEKELRLRRNTTFGVCGFVSSLSCLSFLLTTNGFYDFKTFRYPDMPEQLRSVLFDKNGNDEIPSRVISFGPERWRSEKFVYSLHLNFATVYRVPSVIGYDPLIEDQVSD